MQKISADSPPADSPPAAPRWQGQLQMRFDCQPKQGPEQSPEPGQTRPTVLMAQAPFKVQRPFYPEGPTTCHTTILHTAGGIVRGDQLAVQLDLHPQAQALVTTAAASKIYGSPVGDRPRYPAEQKIHLQLAPGAYLEWLPQETIIFAGADYRQQLSIDLAPGATCLGWEITRFGRTARGERFTAGLWQSGTEVWQQGCPLWINRDYLPGGSVLLDSPHGLAGFPLVGTLFWLGKAIDPGLVTAARELWQQQSGPGEAGISRLELGLVCRYRGPDRQTAQDWFIQVWQLLRQHQQQQPICLPRVWPI